MNKRIGFDFDKVFVNYPPLIPDFLINNLYKKSSKKLTYRYPGKIEKIIRQISHLSLFRKPIKKNIRGLVKISKNKKVKRYLISSRFSFLKARTEKWLNKQNLKQYFDGIYFNFEDKQPHMFKDKIIKKEKITDYIDDDLDLLKYLQSKNPEVNFYWLSEFKIKSAKTNKIIAIKSVQEFVDKYL